MSDIRLELIVSNLNAPGRQKEVTFLVDTGATRAWLPEEIAKELAIQAAGTVPLELADGSVKDYPYGYCFFTFGEETVAGNVIIGPAGSEPLVGTQVLQDFRLIIDLERQTVSRSRALQAESKFISEKEEKDRSIKYIIEKKL